MAQRKFRHPDGHEFAQLLMEYDCELTLRRLDVDPVVPWTPGTYNDDLICDTCGLKCQYTEARNLHNFLFDHAPNTGEDLDVAFCEESPASDETVVKEAHAKPAGVPHLGSSLVIPYRNIKLFHPL
jgi:hypothetical protein